MRVPYGAGDNFKSSRQSGLVGDYARFNLFWNDISEDILL